jgi:hypothetical protein
MPDGYQRCLGKTQAERQTFHSAAACRGRTSPRSVNVREIFLSPAALHPTQRWAILPLPGAWGLFLPPPGRDLCPLSKSPWAFSVILRVVPPVGPACATGDHKERIVPYLRIALSCLITAAMLSNSGPVSAEPKVSFNRDIRPILADRCFQCHGPDEKARQAELRLDLRDAAIQSAIVPGNAQKSPLIQRVASSDPDQRMPPADSHRQPLDAGQIDALRAWIDAGATYDRHWAFIPPVRPPLPTVNNESWAGTPIDRIVLAKLENEGLAPAAEADRRTLIRRLSLDLTGLPPTPDEVEAFVRDDSPQAYEKVVDRLLQSQRYGEHMARYWLDAARYADTNGYQYDLEREQWVWRDWVIHAFNSNMPFDQFTIEQMAGDLLPDATDQQKLATAFHRNHPITIEGGVIDEEYRSEYVADRVVTTSTVWMGMTLLCARCHDHKFDPISQKEFYQFFAFFNQVPEKGNSGFDPKLQVASPLASMELDSLQRQIVAAERELERLAGDAGSLPADWQQALSDALQRQWSIATPAEMVSEGGAEMQLEDDGIIWATGTNPPADTYEFTFTLDGPVRAIRLEALTHPSHVNGSTGRGSNGNFVLSEFQVELAAPTQPDTFESVRIVSAEADYSQPNYPIHLAIDGRIDATGWAVDGNTRFENRLAVFTLAGPAGEKGSRLRVRLLNKYGGMHQMGRLRLAFSSGDAPPFPLELAAVLGIPAEQRTPADQQRLRRLAVQRFGTREARAAVTALAELHERHSELKKNIPATMVMQEMAAPRATHVLYRGEYDKPREQVSPGTPASLPPLADDQPRNRLGLARWLVSPEHPLTARVTVNRLWQRLFGAGIVKTSEDFWVQGEWPSHPELLDWLAVEFIESGWDVKALLKSIVMSSTYRQSSRVTPALMDRDPENRLLARGPRLRLDAEVIRDSALLAGGLLDKQLGGPSVFPYHPEGLWQEINNRPGYSREYLQDRGDKLYRRSMYTFWKRTVPPPSMAAFDAPEREFCVVRRSRTNTPLQAFVLLHDPQFVEAARQLGQRMITEGGDTADQRAAFGFHVCMSRPPSDAERQVLIDALEQRLLQYRADPGAAEKLLAVGDSPRNASLDAAEYAACTTLARMIMNLSEFVTKE